MDIIKIEHKDKGKTLINFLRKKFPIGYIHKLFRKSAIRVNGKRAKEELVLQKNDEVNIMLSFSKEGVDASPRGFKIVKEYDDFVIVDKSPNLPVHEAPNAAKSETLIHKLEEYYAKQEVVPFLVHRLDASTSGCLLVGKNEDKREELEGLFISDENDGGKLKVIKTYIALVKGIPQKKIGFIDTKLKGRGKTKVSAHTDYELITSFKQHNVSLLLVKIKTGRLHQIRQHLSMIRLPIVMDDKYGDQEFNRRFMRKTKLKRQFLHSFSLEFELDGEKIYAECKMPFDLEGTLKKLKEWK